MIITSGYSATYLGTQVDNSVTIPSGSHTLVGNYTVATGQTLLIQAGAIINATGSFGFIINGTLTIEGTSGNHVIMDHQSGGASRWYGIYYAAGSHGSIQYLDIQRAGADGPSVSGSSNDAAIHINDADILVENIHVTLSANWSVYYKSTLSDSVIFHNNRATNVTKGFRFETDGTLSFENIVVDTTTSSTGLYVYGGDTEITRCTTRATRGDGFYLDDKSNDTLKMSYIRVDSSYDEGIESNFKHAEYRNITTLRMRGYGLYDGGASGHLIIDSVTAMFSLSNDGIRLNQYPSDFQSISNLVLDSNDESGLYYGGGTPIKIFDSQMKGNKYGVYCYYQCEITQNTIMGNLYGVYINNTSFSRKSKVHHNVISDNTKYGLFINGDTTLVDRNTFLNNNVGIRVNSQGRIYHNTIIVSTGDTGIVLEDNITGTNVQNNLIHGGLVGVHFETNTSLTMRYNQVTSGAAFFSVSEGSHVYGQLTGQNSYGDDVDVYTNVIEIPLFQDSTGGNYALQITSPGVDGGSSLIESNFEDNAPDPGRFEYGTASLGLPYLYQVDTLWYDSIDLNSPTRDTMITLRNTGSDSVIIDSITYTSANLLYTFTDNISNSQKFGPDDFGYISVSFTPTLNSINQDTLKVFFNGSATPKTVLLYGFVDERLLSMSVSSVLFPHRVYNSDSTADTSRIFIKNNGKLQLNISSVSLVNSSRQTINIPSDTIIPGQDSIELVIANRKTSYYGDGSNHVIITSDGGVDSISIDSYHYYWSSSYYSFNRNNIYSYNAPSDTLSQDSLFFDTIQYFSTNSLSFLKIDSIVTRGIGGLELSSTYTFPDTLINGDTIDIVLQYTAKGGISTDSTFIYSNFDGYHYSEYLITTVLGQFGSFLIKDSLQKTDTTIVIRTNHINRIRLNLTNTGFTEITASNWGMMQGTNATIVLDSLSESFASSKTMADKDANETETFYIDFYSTSLTDFTSTDSFYLIDQYGDTAFYPIAITYETGGLVITPVALPFPFSDYYNTPDTLRVTMVNSGISPIRLFDISENAMSLYLLENPEYSTLESGDTAIVKIVYTHNSSGYIGALDDSLYIYSDAGSFIVPVTGYVYYFDEGYLETNIPLNTFYTTSINDTFELANPKRYMYYFAKSTSTSAYNNSYFILDSIGVIGSKSTRVLSTSVVFPDTMQQGDTIHFTLIPTGTFGSHLDTVVFYSNVSDTLYTMNVELSTDFTLLESDVSMHQITPTVYDTAISTRYYSATIHFGQVDSVPLSIKNVVDREISIDSIRMNTNAKIQLLDTVFTGTDSFLLQPGDSILLKTIAKGILTEDTILYDTIWVFYDDSLFTFYRFDIHYKIGTLSLNDELVNTEKTITLYSTDTYTDLSLTYDSEGHVTITDWFLSQTEGVILDSSLLDTSFLINSLLYSTNPQTFRLRFSNTFADDKLTVTDFTVVDERGDSVTFTFNVHNKQGNRPSLDSFSLDSLQTPQGMRFSFKASDTEDDISGYTFEYSEDGATYITATGIHLTGSEAISSNIPQVLYWNSSTDLGFENKTISVRLTVRDFSSDITSTKNIDGITITNFPGDYYQDNRIDLLDFYEIIRTENNKKHFLDTDWIIENELFPFTGTLPVITVQGDSIFDAGDLATFSQSWNNYLETTVSSLSLPGKNYSNHITFTMHHVYDNIYTISMKLEPPTSYNAYQISVNVLSENVVITGSDFYTNSKDMAFLQKNSSGFSNGIMRACEYCKDQKIGFVQLKGVTAQSFITFTITTIDNTNRASYEKVTLYFTKNSPYDLSQPLPQSNMFLYYNAEYSPKHLFYSIFTVDGTLVYRSNSVADPGYSIIEVLNIQQKANIQYYIKIDE